MSPFNRMHRWDNLLFGDAPPDSDEPDALGFTHGWTHHIINVNSAPFRVRVTKVEPATVDLSPDIEVAPFFPCVFTAGV